MKGDQAITGKWSKPAVQGRFSRALDALIAENATRIPCPKCGLAVLDYWKHMRIVHDD